MKRRRIFPDKPLGEPVKRFEDTFSAETVMMEAFFPKAVAGDINPSSAIGGAANKFRYFAPDPPASIPAVISEPFEMKTTRERIAEREAWIASTEVCQCCGGKGRTTPAVTSKED